MIADGELEDDSFNDLSEENQIADDLRKNLFADDLHQSLIQNMRHLSKQEEKGISGMNRWNEIFKILLVLCLLGVFIWFLFYRK